MEEAGIKTATGHQIWCHTTLQNVIWSTIVLCIHISENNVLHLRQHLFPEVYLFIYFFPDIIMVTFLQYLVCCIAYCVASHIPFSYVDKHLA